MRAAWIHPASRLPARPAFRVITLAWGATMLAEAVTRVLIVATIPAGTALFVVKLMPYIVIAGLLRWMAGYTRRLRHQAADSAADGTGPARAIVAR